MVERVPKLIDPIEAAEKHRHFKGSIPFAEMAELQDALLQKSGVVHFDLRFGKDGHLPVVTGNVQASLELECQCCLGSIELPVQSQVNLAVVSSIDQANQLSEHYDPLLVEQATVAIADIVQAELLLAIPYVPRHEACGGRPDSRPASSSESEQATTAQRPNPFAVLASLKKKD